MAKSQERIRFPKLNLPPADLRLHCCEGITEVYDTQRMKWVALTPEEWVRQHFVAMLIGNKGYTASRIANEVSATYNGVKHRCDTVIYGRDKTPRMIIEYKAPWVKINQTTFDQIARYNLFIKARYVVISNGITHYVCCCDNSSGQVTFLSDLPSAEELEK